LDYVRQQGIYIYRGDPAAADFDQTDFTDDNAWHDLDLSNIAPEHAKAVDVSFIFINSASSKIGNFRRKGQTNIHNSAVIASNVPNLPQATDLTIALDPNRKIEYRLDAGGWSYIRFTVKGWWY